MDDLNMPHTASRKLAQQALDLAAPASPRPWLRGSYAVYSGQNEDALAVIPHTIEMEPDNLDFIAGARALVPDLANALIAALDERDDAQGEARAAELHRNLNRGVAGALGLLKMQLDPESGEMCLPSWHDMPARVAELVKERDSATSALTAIRAYMTRSIAEDLAGMEEATELLNGLDPLDHGMVMAWTTAMADPAYWSKRCAALIVERDARPAVPGNHPADCQSCSEDSDPCRAHAQDWRYWQARALDAEQERAETVAELREKLIAMELEANTLPSLVNEFTALRALRDAVLKLEASLAATAHATVPETASMWYAPMAGMFVVESADLRRATRDRLIPAILWWACEAPKPERAPEHRALTERCLGAERERDELRATLAKVSASETEMAQEIQRLRGQVVQCERMIQVLGTEQPQQEQK